MQHNKKVIQPAPCAQRCWQQKVIYQKENTFTVMCKLDMQFWIESCNSLRFLHDLSLFGVWWGKSGGASPEESPKLDRTLSILIISASIRGLTGSKQSFSIPSPRASEAPEQTNTHTHSLITVSYFFVYVYYVFCLISFLMAQIKHLP